jgi:hypothetical protein
MNVMIDLETLGTRPGCVILSIGAAVFDEKDIVHRHHVIISTNGGRNHQMVGWSDRRGSADRRRSGGAGRDAARSGALQTG